MCDPLEATTPSVQLESTAADRQGMSRRRVLGTMGAASAGIFAFADLLGRASPAQAAQDTAPQDTGGASVILLGTNGGPPPLAARYGISSALVVNGKVYVVDCGRGALSQFVQAGLSLKSLAGIFLTHLHSDHTVDYFSFPLLSATTGAFTSTEVYGPGPAGEPSLVPSAPGPVPGIAGLTSLANQAFAASTTFFKAEKVGADPVTLVNVHEVLPPASAGASLSTPAPTMAPFTVLDNSDVKVTAVCVPHGAVYPAYAYRSTPITAASSSPVTPHPPRTSSRWPRARISWCTRRWTWPCTPGWACRPRSLPTSRPCTPTSPSLAGSPRRAGYAPW